MKISRQDIKQYADEIFPWVLQVKNQLHQHPEAGFKEYKTAKIVEKALSELHIPYERICKTGIVAFIEGKNKGKTVAVRADMDGLPIEEKNENGVCSVNSGYMHACGHDAHMAIALGTARFFSENRDQIFGNIKLLFQPAEETDGGALPMIEAGCLENPFVDYCIGQHVQPYLKTGEAECKKGALNGASNTMKVTVLGRGGHGAAPHKAVDAIAIASYIITILQTIVSREVGPTDSAVISVGEIHGGTAGNIIADKVVFNAIIRTISPDTRKHIVKRLPEMIKGIAQSMGGNAEILIEDGYEALVNNSDCVDVFYLTAKEYLGEKNVYEKATPSLGVEDFAFFARQVRSVFYHIGCTNEAVRKNTELHSNTFQVDDESLKTGIGLQISMVLKLLKDDTGC